MDLPPSAVYFVSPGAVSNESTFDEYAANPRFLQLQTELRSWLVVGANSRDQTRENSVTPHEEGASGAQHKPGYQYLWDHVRNGSDQIPLSRKLKYLRVWISDCAPWLDMFDQERHFGIQVPILAQRSAAVFNAMLAVAARTAERQGIAEGSQDSLELYSQAISSLTSSLNAKEPYVLVTACVLCVLEMMSVSPRDWRRHVEGCAALCVSSGVNGFSGGLLQAVFWCYARMDLCGAIIADGAESTVLPIENWVPLALGAATDASITSDREIGAEFLTRGQNVPDMHANYAVYLCAKVCDLLSRRTRYLELHEDNGCGDDAFPLEWNRVWNELQEWFTRRPVEMVPVQSTSGHTDKPLFPSIFFAHWAAISGNQLYHTACVMMLEIKPDGVSDSADSVDSLLWHARRIVGISLTNPHAGCINNAIQPLYVAGKLFTHREEQEVIVKLVVSIEVRTGWGSRWRLKDLEAVWGCRRGEYS